MSIILDTKFIVIGLAVLIFSLFFSTSVFAQDASSSASPSASSTPTPSATPTPSPSESATPTPSPSSVSGSTTSSPTPTPKPSGKVLGAATSLGATGREIDFIKWVLLAAVFLVSLFIGVRALRSNVKE